MESTPSGPNVTAAWHERNPFAHGAQITLAKAVNPIFGMRVTL